MPTQVRSSDSNSIAHWEGYGARETFAPCLQESNSAQPVWKMVGQFLTKLNIFHEATTEFLDIYPNELKPYIHTTIFTWVLRPLFITGKTQDAQDAIQQWRLPYDSHPMDYYFSSLKRVINHKETQRRHKWVLLSDRHQCEAYNIEDNNMAAWEREGGRSHKKSSGL